MILRCKNLQILHREKTKSGNLCTDVRSAQKPNAQTAVPCRNKRLVQCNVHVQFTGTATVKLVLGAQVVQAWCKYSRFGHRGMGVPCHAGTGGPLQTVAVEAVWVLAGQLGVREVKWGYLSDSVWNVCPTVYNCSILPFGAHCQAIVTSFRR